MPPGPRDPLLGSVLDGRYRILERLGVGGMAVVYLADDLLDGRRVAVKVVDVPKEQREHLERRFRREFEACSRIEHPNVIRLHAAGRTPGDSLYYAMDYLPGSTLADELGRSKRLPEGRVLDLLEQLGAAFAAFHPLGIVHRDLKPANVMVTEGGRFVLMDFGLARDMGADRLTRTGTALGTPLYMTPELARGRAADARSDIAQLGIVAYEALTGQRAYEATNLQELLVKVDAASPAPPSRVAPGLAPAWDVFLANCMARDPADRYGDADDLLRDVALLRAGRSPVSRASRRDRITQDLPILAPTLTAPTPPAPPPPQAPPSARRPAPSRTVEALALAVLGAVAVLGLSLWRARPDAAATEEGFEDLRCAAGPTSLRLTWSSARAYPTVVRIERPEDRTVSNQADGSTRRHELVIDGLTEGTTYTWRVVFPSGRTSLPQSATTPRLTAELLRVGEGPGGLDLAWRATEARAAWLVSVVPGRPEARSPATPGPDGGWSATLPGPDEATAGLLAELELADGQRHRADLGAALRAEVERLVARLDGFSPAAVVGSAVQDCTPDASYLIDTLNRGREDLKATRRMAREKGAQLRPHLQTRLDASGALEPYGRAAALAPLALGTSLLGQGLRTALLERLQRVWSVWLFARWSEAGLAPLPRPALGSFDLRLAPGAPSAREVAVFDAGATPLHMGIHSKLLELGRNTARLERTFELEGLDQVAAAELVLGVDAFDFLALRVRVNDLPELVVADPRKLPEPPPGAAAASCLYQRLPVHGLRSGQNRVELVADPLFGRFTRYTATLARITLRLYPRAPAP